MRGLPGARCQRALVARPAAVGARRGGGRCRARGPSRAQRPILTGAGNPLRRRRRRLLCRRPGAPLPANLGNALFGPSLRFIGRVWLVAPPLTAQVLCSVEGVRRAHEVEGDERVDWVSEVYNGNAIRGSGVGVVDEAGEGRGTALLEGPHEFLLSNSPWKEPHENMAARRSVGGDQTRWLRGAAGGGGRAACGATRGLPVAAAPPLRGLPGLTVRWAAIGAAAGALPWWRAVRRVIAGCGLPAPGHGHRVTGGA